MLRSEFDLIYDNLKKGTDLEYVKRPTDDEYELIEFVYNWHPLNFSKEAVVSLYDKFGMIIFYDMEQRSKMAMERDVAMREYDAQIKRLEEAKMEYIDDHKLFGRFDING